MNAIGGTTTGTTVGAELDVDSGTIAANTAAIARHTGVAVMAVVKAGGFGHGDAVVARAALAGGATWLGVTSIAEALALREAGIDAPVLSWLNPVATDLAPALAADVDVAVPSREHLDDVVRAALSASAGHAPARVHLYLDCGPARDGASWADWPALCAAAARAQRAGLISVVGVMGHLSCADEPGHPANTLARQRFTRGVAVARATGLNPRHRHLAATAAALADPRARHSMVRIGAGLYGIDYGLGGVAGRPALRFAATLTAPVVAVRDVAAGTPVGYGGTWVAPRPSRLALLPLGYADGLPRAASGAAQVLLAGRRCAIVGRISMDQAVVDVTGVPVAPGDRAVVFGPGDSGEPTLTDWAGWAGTIEHEIATGIGARVARTSRPLSPAALPTPSASQPRRAGSPTPQPPTSQPRPAPALTPSRTHDRSPLCS